MKLNQHDVGGEIISILTRGMYADPKDALREYVQNGVDAGSLSIDIKIRQNNIVIEDEGCGMDKVVMRKALRLGISDKNPKRAVGFMGIGLYSSFHLCDTLTITSRIGGKTPNRLQFEFKKMRDVLDAQKEQRIDAEAIVPDQIALLTLMEENTSLIELITTDYPAVGTRVELSGLEPDFFDSLSKFDEVADYLEKSIPLPFSPKFKYGQEIQECIEKICREHDADFKTINLKLQINTREENLYKPYVDDDFNPEPLKPIFKELVSADGFLGIAWGCLNKATEIIKNEDVRGFLIKKHGFTIGTRNNLLGVFGAKFFNRYVGEFIIVHPKLLPNGARSEFEYSPLRTTLKKVIQDTANEFNSEANKHQEIEKAEVELDKLIKLYRETKAHLIGLAASREMLLDRYGLVQKAYNSVKKRYDTGYKIKESRRSDAKGILELTFQLIKEISDLLTQKKEQQKKSTSIQRSEIAEELKTAPTAHDYAEPQPHNFIEVVELIGIPFNDEVREIFRLIDQTYIRVRSKNEDDYLDQLKKIKSEIEDLLSDEES